MPFDLNNNLNILLRKLHTKNKIFRHSYDYNPFHAVMWSQVSCSPTVVLSSVFVVRTAMEWFGKELFKLRRCLDKWNCLIYIQCSDCDPNSIWYIYIFLLNEYKFKVCCHCSREFWNYFCRIDFFIFYDISKTSQVHASWIRFIWIDIYIDIVVNVHGKCGLNLS